MNKISKFGLSVAGILFGVSAILSGCAPTATKTSSSALPPAQKPAAVSPSQTSQAPSTQQSPQSNIEKEYPWLSTYNIELNSNNIHFAFNKSALTADSKMILKKDAIYLEYNPGVSIQIQGNCDKRGSEAYNLALGWRRANAAKAYLVDLGINSGRIETISYGKEKPLCNNNTEECYAKNRRDHFMVTSK